LFVWTTSSVRLVMSVNHAVYYIAYFFFSSIIQFSIVPIATMPCYLVVLDHFETNARLEEHSEWTLLMNSVWKLLFVHHPPHHHHRRIGIALVLHLFFSSPRLDDTIRTKTGTYGMSSTSCANLTWISHHITFWFRTGLTWLHVDISFLPPFYLNDGWRCIRTKIVCLTYRIIWMNRTAAITTSGVFPVVPRSNIILYNWDGQTLCPRTDCFSPLRVLTTRGI
jgi:hypothetical protein